MLFVSKIVPSEATARQRRAHRTLPHRVSLSGKSADWSTEFERYSNRPSGTGDGQTNGISITSAGDLLQKRYIALFGIAVEIGAVMVIYLQEALDQRIAGGTIDTAGIEAATIEGAVQRLRPKLITVTEVMMSLAPIL